MKNNVINFVCFQVGWFLCVLSAAYGYPSIAPIGIVVLLAIHFVFHKEYGTQVILIATSLILGILTDSVLIFLDVFEPEYPFFISAISPVWMWALWVNFSTTLNASLAWLQNRPVLAAIFGVLGGPAAYYAGEKLGAMSLNEDLIYSIGMLGIVWGVVTPLLTLTARAASNENKT